MKNENVNSLTERILNKNIEKLEDLNETETIDNNIDVDNINKISLNFYNTGIITVLDGNIEMILNVPEDYVENFFIMDLSEYCDESLILTKFNKIISLENNSILDNKFLTKCINKHIKRQNNRKLLSKINIKNISNISIDEKIKFPKNGLYLLTNHIVVDDEELKTDNYFSIIVNEK